MTPKVLVIEDEPDVAEVVSFAVRLALPGSEVLVARDGQEALRCFADAAPDLVVLDVAIPPPDGFEVCRRIRELSPVPILMLTVRDATADKVRGFGLGADDYLTKPFEVVELQARLQALVRRANLAATPAAAGYSAGDLEIDFEAREVRLRGEPVRLTATEYRLLEELARHPGATVPHHVLLARVWGVTWQDPDRLKVFVRRLRRKLGDDAAQPRWIQTDWGVGYRLNPSES